MIRSTKLSYKWANAGKRLRLERFVDTYRDVLQDFVDILWEMDAVPMLVPKEAACGVPNRGLSARAIQAASKQASGVVRGTRQKHKQRLYVLDKLVEEGDKAGATRLRKFIEKNPCNKPNCTKVCPELDSRFTLIDLNPEISFEICVTLRSLGETSKIELPFNRTQHFNKMLDKGELKKGVRLSKRGITFMFEIPDPPKRAEGSTLGIDIGQREIVSASNGFQPGPNNHGHDLSTITPILCRRHKGSVGFRKAQTHRSNYVNWSINRLNLAGVRQVNREDIKNLRKGKVSSRRLNHWTYTAIIGKLESRCEELGVLVHKVDPVYTSQRCHECGYTRKSNRKGVQFKCGACGFVADADLNASLNIALDLPSMRKDRHLERNRTGFYWLPVDGSLQSPLCANPIDI